MPSQRGGSWSFHHWSNDTPWRRFVIAGVVLTGVVAVFGYALASGTAFGVGADSISDVVTIVVAAAMPPTSLWAAVRARGRTRLAWGLMAGAGLSWLVGEIVWLVENRVLFTEAVPAVSDVFYLLALVPAAASLIAFPPPLQSRTERTRDLLAAAVVVGSVLFVSRALVLSVVLPTTSGRWLEQAVGLAYPVTDVVLVCVALVVLVRVGAGARLHLVLLTAGFLVYAVSDSLYVREAALDVYASGSMLDLGWVAGYALFALAPLAPNASLEASTAEPETRVRRYDWSSLSLHVPLLAAVVVAASAPNPWPDAFLIVTGLATLVVFVVRQALLAGDHRRLRLDLEAQVGQLRIRSAELRQLASENEGVIQSVVDGVFGVDAAGRLTFVNPPAAAMLGRTAEELVGSLEGMLFYDFGRDGGAGTAAPGRPATSAVAAALGAGTAVTSARALLRRGDGSVFPVELAVGPIREADRVVGAVVVFRDVSARLAVEKMKNEFVSVVSHELRTPLTSIRGSLGLLHSGLGGELSTRGDRMVSIALESSERLSRLIEDMLDLERMESGALTMVPVVCELGPLVATALNEVDSMARKHGVRLRSPDLDGVVRGDADRIVQTLTNVLGNSIKFSPRGASVEVSLAQRGDLVEFAVADHGRGIPADRVGRIFERFEQVDSSDSRERGGTGLGLSISRDIVELHGGTIWVESELGQGSTFRFTLPGMLRTSAPVPASSGGALPRRARPGVPRA